MSTTRILAFGITLMLANILDIATSNSAITGTHWCKIIMGKCFRMDTGSWVRYQ